MPDMITWQIIFNTKAHAVICGQHRIFLELQAIKKTDEQFTLCEKILGIP
jgi:hypothetical protein